MNWPQRHHPVLRSRARRAAARGFTLIELLVTFVLLAVMLTLAAPSFMTFQRNAELTSAANSFVAAMSAARAEAMKRQRPAFVVPRSGTSWATGWFVFVDTNSDIVPGGNVEPSAGDTVISEQAALPSSVTVTASSFPVSGATAYVRFNGSGSFTTLANGFQSGSLTLSNGTAESRRIIANPTGRLRVCKTTETGCGETDDAPS